MGDQNPGKVKKPSNRSKGNKNKSQGTQGSGSGDPVAELSESVRDVVISEPSSVQQTCQGESQGSKPKQKQQKAPAQQRQPAKQQPSQERPPKPKKQPQDQRVPQATPGIINAPMANVPPFGSILGDGSGHLVSSMDQDKASTSASSSTISTPSHSKSSSAGKTGKGKVKGKENKGKKDSRPFSGDEEKKTTISLADFRREIGLKGSDSLPGPVCYKRLKDPGTLGRRVPLFVNFYRMRLSGIPIYQYDITFSKQERPMEEEREAGRVFRRVTKRLNQKLLETFVQGTGRDVFAGCRYAYDNGRMMITNKRLSLPGQGNNDFQFMFDEFAQMGAGPENRAELHQITIQETADYRLEFDPDGHNNESILQAMDIICKAQAFQQYIVYGSKIFFPDGKDRVELARNLPNYEVTIGYHQSAFYNEGGPMMNIDRAIAVLYRPGPLIRRVYELLGRGPNSMEPISPREMQAMNEFRLVRVSTDYRGYVSNHTIQGFSDRPCGELFFGQGLERRSIIDYFSQTYNIRIRYANLPCVCYGPDKYIPVELCTLLPDQRYQKKLRIDMQSALTNLANVNTQRRQTETQRSAQRIATEAQPITQDFGIGLDTSRMLAVESRVLDPPTLSYKAKTFRPQLGKWNLKELQFFGVSGAIERWSLFVFASRAINQQIAQEFVSQLVRCARRLGLNLAQQCDIQHIDNLGVLRANLEKLPQKGTQLLVTIIPGDADVYARIKNHCDKVLGIPHQNIHARSYDPRAERGKIKLFNDQYLSNVLLKINAKLGGKNHGISDKPSLLRERTMAIGIDVNHPSPGEQAPSIAAVVGSIDQDYSLYRTELRLNNHRDETVNMGDMIRPILEAFKARNKSYPKNLIIYRDGVSEGYFWRVLAFEVWPLIEVLRDIGAADSKITFIVNRKRHNVRFYPQKEADGLRNGNILPGSVIDQMVVDRNWPDFYLCSHNSLLGTARPGRYTVLWDDRQMSADELQQVTYYFAYLFARSTSSISDPAPARYAHLAAARGKEYQRVGVQDLVINARLDNRLFYV